MIMTKFIIHSEWHTCIELSVQLEQKYFLSNEQVMKRFAVVELICTAPFVLIFIQCLNIFSYIILLFGLEEMHNNDTNPY